MPLQQIAAPNFNRNAAISPSADRLPLSPAAARGSGKNPRLSFASPRARLAAGTALATLLSLAVTLTGCHSAYIDATVSNHTTAPISVVQVEYPSASFGTQTIAPGADFHYRFKILGSGPMKITWTDTAEHEQKATGPTLIEGTEGPLAITVAPDGVHWRTPPAAR